LKDERACHHQDLAVGLERGGTIGDTQVVGEIRTRFPASLENRGVGGAAGIGSGGEDAPVVHQDRGPDLE
jgi:hypothetical protein